MKATYQIITPLLAQKMLDRSDFKNRSLKPALVRRYAGDMAIGRWKENGESIVVDESGAVLDGQHRLHALISSGRSFGFVVVQGVPRNAFDTLDSGKNRSAADTLQVAGLKHCKSTAAILRLIKDYKDNGETAFTRKASTKLEVSFDVQAAIAEYPLANQSAAFCHSNLHHAVLNPISMIGTFHYLFGEKSIETRDDFFKRLMAMNFQGADCPVRALSSVYQNTDTLKSMAVNRVVRAAFWVKAWNAFRSGGKIKKLYFVPEHHEFPSII